MNKIITLNVGGVKMQTLLDTITKSEYFKALIERWNKNNSNEEIFIDEDPNDFKYILNILRDEDIYAKDIDKLDSNTKSKINKLCKKYCVNYTIYKILITTQQKYIDKINYDFCCYNDQNIELLDYNITAFCYEIKKNDNYYNFIKHFNFVEAENNVELCILYIDKMIQKIQIGNYSTHLSYICGYILVKTLDTDFYNTSGVDKYFSHNNIESNTIRQCIYNNKSDVNTINFDETFDIDIDISNNNNDKILYLFVDSYNVCINQMIEA